MGKEKSCENCGNAFFDVESEETQCSLSKEKAHKCFIEGLSRWKPKEEVAGIIKAETVAVEVAGMIYNQGKAKIFNVLESQVEGQKLAACKRIVEDILSNISKLVADYLLDVLGDWEMEVTAGGELTPEEEKKAIKEWEEVEDTIKAKTRFLSS